MTIKEWISSRAPEAPSALMQQMVAALGGDADVPESRTTEVCLAAATRTLDALLSEGRFARDSALALLAVDALTTSAFEHASVTATSDEELELVAQRGAEILGQLTTQRV